jgi:ABC-2 type transport system permease protein
MNIWNFLKKDWAIFFKDRGAMMWLFVLPVVFIAIFAGLARMSFGSSNTAEEKDTRAPVAVVNLDEGGAISQQFIDSLNRSQVFKAALYEQQEAEQLIQKYAIKRYLVIPVDFSTRLGSGERVTISLVVHPDADPNTTQTIMRVINGIANDTSLELQILDGIRQMGEMQANNPAVQTGFNSDRVLNQAKLQFEESRSRPLVDLVETTPTSPAENKLDFDLSQTTVPGFAVLFVFLAASTVAHGVFEERKAGTLRRLLSSPLTRSTILAGKMVPIFLLTLVQIIFIFLAGALLLPLIGFGKLSVGSNPVAWAVTSILIALCSTCLGILIASIATSEGQVGGISNALLWVAGILGGAIFPTFLIQQMPVLNVLSRLVPQSWATSAYYDILTRGKGLPDIWLDLAVLLAFSAVFFFVGVRRFKFE